LDRLFGTIGGRVGGIDKALGVKLYQKDLTVKEGQEGGLSLINSTKGFSFS